MNNRDDQPSFPFSLVGQTQSRCHRRVTSHIAKTNGEATRQQESKQKKKINRVQPHKVGMSNWMSRRRVAFTSLFETPRTGCHGARPSSEKGGIFHCRHFHSLLRFSRKAFQCVTDDLLRGGNLGFLEGSRNSLIKI